MLKLLSPVFMLLALLPGISPGAAVESPALPDPTIQVSNQDGALVLNISYRVPVSPREAWAVLTDFENMPGFITSLESSKVLQRSGNTLQVEQKGSIELGVLPIHYESRRQLDVIPYQSIRSHSLSGNIHLDSIMVLSQAGNSTLLSYHATALPDLPVPNSLLGSYVGKMLENQFKSMGQEMVRRAQADSGNADDANKQIGQQAGEKAVPQSGQPAVQQTSKPVGKQPVPQPKPATKKARAQAKKRPG